MKTHRVFLRFWRSQKVHPVSQKRPFLRLVAFFVTLFNLRTTHCIATCFKINVLPIA